MAVVTEQMISQGELWIVVFVHDDYSQANTTGRLPFECGPEQMSSLMDLWIVVYVHGGSGQGDTTGRELDDRVVVRGHDDSGKNAWKIRDLITLGSSAVAEFATEVFSCAYEACSAWNVSVPSHENALDRSMLPNTMWPTICLISAPCCPDKLITLWPNSAYNGRWQRSTT